MPSSSLPPPPPWLSLEEWEKLIAATTRAQIYMLVGFWVEAVIYGIYVVLFIAALRVMIQKKPHGHPRSKILFILITILMFVLTSFYSAVNVYRTVQAFAIPRFDITDPHFWPLFWFSDFSAWYNFVYSIVSSMLFWIADALIIYRCYIVWGRSFRIIFIPLLLLTVSVVTNSINLYWFLNPRRFTFREIRPLLHFVYPGHLAQNLMTTALIAYKIWRQHLKSVASGVRISSNLTLLTITRILIESAMVYTLQLSVLLVLYFLQHPAQVILQAAIVPSTGIVFVLMSLRVHMALQDSARLPNPSSLVLPSWIHRGTEGTETVSEGSSGPTSSMSVLISHTKTQQIDSPC